MKLFQILLSILIITPNAALASGNWKVESLGSYEISLDIPDMGGLSAIKLTNFGKNF